MPAALGKNKTTKTLYFCVLQCLYLVVNYLTASYFRPAQHIVCERHVARDMIFLLSKWVLTKGKVF